MQESIEETRKRRVSEIFDQLRAAGKTEEEIFGESVEGLKQLARKMINRQHPGNSLHATRLLNDVYVKLFDQPTSEFRWERGEEFFLAVARAMHDLKVDYIRRKMAKKRGSGKVQSLDTAKDVLVPAFELQALDAAAVDKALRKLKEEFPDREKIIVLRYWGQYGRSQHGDGLTYSEIADLLKVEEHYVRYTLKTAQARIQHYLSVGES